MPVSTSKRTRLDLYELWRRARAVVEGESAVKDLDSIVDTIRFTNLLVPFNNTQTQAQYDFYKAEAELPGLVSQYVRIIIGGLLRKEPSLTITKPERDVEGLTEEAIALLEANDISEEVIYKAIKESLVSENNGILSFILRILEEELITSRSAVTIALRDSESVTDKNLLAYPVLWKAEEIINWQTDDETLTRVVFSYEVEETTDDEYDFNCVTYYQDHFINSFGVYQVDTYRETGVTAESNSGYDLHETVVPSLNGETFDYLPVWFMNDSIEPVIPILTPMVDTELSLYNKMSRRNHLLHGAAAYTPVVFSKISDEDFSAVVAGGLGSWLKFDTDARIDTLTVPTDVLSDMEKAIAQGIEKLGRMGVNLLMGNDKMTNVSSSALSVRLSPQVAQLGLLNTKISTNLSEILTLLIRWNFNEEVTVDFNLSADFNSTPVNSDLLRILGEFHTSNILPRYLFIEILKANDIIPESYDDKRGQEAIRNSDILTGLPLPENEPAEEGVRLDPIEEDE